ncbi:MAG TPA: hypothetical protein VFN35_20505, partial [Ktedonobacteraceae bacterium]|nr:hypothetical protein [Ktedonobacteraceae bacterium]
NGWRARRSGWVTQHRVGHEDPGPNEAEANDPEQDGLPGGTMARAQEQPESEGKTEHERSADDEVGDLHPPTLPQAERADSVLPDAVVRTRGAFDEKDHNEEQRTNGTASQEQPDCRWLLSNALY